MPEIHQFHRLESYNFAVPSDFTDQYDIAAMAEAAQHEIAAPGQVRETPMTVERVPETGVTLYTKDEGLQLGRCFKVRGAFNAVPRYRAQGVNDFIVASAGSHALAMNKAVAVHGGKLEIAVPSNTPDTKLQQMAGAHTTIHADFGTFDEAKDYALMRSTLTGQTFVHPFADPYVMAGQGTVGLELLNQVPNMTHVVLPVGGGGLLVGVASVIKAVRPEVKVVAVQVERCAAFIASLQLGRRVVEPAVDTRFGGVAVGEPDPLNLALAERLIDHTVVLTPHEVYRALATEQIGREEAGAVAPTAARLLAHHPDYAGATLVSVATGANPSSQTAHFARQSLAQELEAQAA